MVACRTWTVSDMAKISILHFVTRVTIVVADSGTSHSTDLQIIHRLVANSVSLDPPSARFEQLGICGARIC